MKHKKKSSLIVSIFLVAASLTITPATMKTIAGVRGESEGANDYDQEASSATLRRERREMKVILTTSSGRACRANCLNEGHYFCSSDDF